MVSCFNFRGGEFGNWQNKRQECLNCAVDAFSDLAYITNLPFSAMSVCFTGERAHRLTVAWGSRGNGRAAAHYEPITTVINLTKFKGAGTLAHEWGHALDHALGRWCMQNKEHKMQKDIHTEYVSYISGVRFHDNTMGENVKRIIECAHDLMTILKFGNGISTEYYKNARKLDMYKAKPYYSTKVELFARAFEAFIEDELEEREMFSEYLVYGTKSAMYKAIYGADVYPMGEERKKINAQFRKLFDLIAEVVVGATFEPQYRKLYERSDSVEDKYFEDEKAVKEREREALQATAAIAKENLDYARGKAMVGHRAGYEPEKVAEDAARQVSSEKKLAEMSGETPKYMKTICCNVIEYSEYTRMVTIQGAGDLEPIQMNVQTLAMLIMTKMVGVCAGAEKLPDYVVSVTVPVLS